MDREQLKEHLKLASEFGVSGISRDPRWRVREVQASRSASDATEEPLKSSPETFVPVSPSKSSVGAAGSTALTLNVIDVLQQIKDEIGPDCKRCKLHALGRSQVVYGVGNPEARLMFVGEAPGADEDQQGVPFVGKAGQLLTKIIEAIGLRRDDVYIANVIKCRPPQNRNPEPDEVEACEGYLFQQIDAIKPRVVVALGKFGAQTLLRTMDPISRLRGRVFEYRGAKLIPTFHPAYLLRNPGAKREVWEDMKLVRSLLGDE